MFSSLLICASLLPDITILKQRNPDITSFMKYREERALKEGQNWVVYHQWLEFEKIPEILKHAVRLSEDAGFYQHQGIDLHEMGEAVKKNLEKGKKIRGGSTITMQLARNLFLTPEKSYSRKLKEIMIATQLEQVLSKDRIFEIYLNIVELGHGVFGFPAAARYYFYKDLKDLTLMEILRLVAVMPKPLKKDPRGSSKYLKWRISWIAYHLAKAETISPHEYEQLKHLLQVPFS